MSSCTQLRRQIKVESRITEIFAEVQAKLPVGAYDECVC